MVISTHLSTITFANEIDAWGGSLRPKIQFFDFRNVLHHIVLINLLACTQIAIGSQFSISHGWPSSHSCFHCRFLRDGPEVSLLRLQFLAKAGG
jgi:hypothetical protein